MRPPLHSSSFLLVRYISMADPSESCERVRRNPSSFVHLFFLIASNSLCAVKLARDPHCRSSHTDQDCTSDMCNYRKEEPQGPYGHKQGLICLGAARGFLPAVMQVSFACTDHGLKAPRNGEHSKQNATSPNTTSHARARFRTVALIARSLGSFTHRYHHNLKESTAKLTGMKYRNLGKSGLRVSCLGLGTWVTFGGQISDEVAEQLMTIAYESGVNLFDTAEVYSGGKAEIILGNIIKKKCWR
ncbi:hypothetical protein CHARACLAT_012656 [Characodon lateralis]|uniref:NADP-dependent oxidoreductase domain-containing protein n=1 Tax=Characodon lateralis TaxID=208331 RepID=A0ABU7F4S4_9TELE|nr:hypothetical protein [Characodon lateralis]